jgi:glycosyltransferase involved in cell wall biosynthesis
MAIVHAPGSGGLPMNLAGQFNQRSGIGRYADELQRQLVGRVRYISCDVTAGPLKGVPLLRQLPLMVRGLDRRAPLHFPKVLGAGALWFQRLPPSVVTVHDLGLLVWPRERQMFNPIDRALLHLSFSALRYADRLIANSIYTKNTILRYLGIPSERVALVPMGVEHRVFWPRDGAAHQLDDRLGIGGWDDWITILNVGTELPRKNVDMLLRIVAGYRQRGRRVRLVKVGDAAEARFRVHTVKTIERLDIRDRVLIIDNVDDENLALLYSAADAFVCASHLEGFSRPTVEAMACGTPVVVAANGALPETVGDCGIIIPSSAAPPAWMDALDSLFGEHAARDGFRQRGLERASEFDDARMARATYDVYATLSTLAGDHGV